MRGQWMYVDFIRAFLPRWLSKMTSLKVFSAVALGLIVFVIVLKAVA